MQQGKVIQAFTAAEYREYLASGQADVAIFYEQQLAYARGVQERLHAFASLDERVIGLQAGHRKAERTRGEPPGRLYGVPVAVEDTLDTIDFPTTFGSPLHAGRYAVADASVVRRLRDAGAVVFGKTATAEFGGDEAVQVANPHNPEHGAGGSAGGSAAAVAAGAVPLSLASQAGASVIRAASYCGVYGFRPSLGLLPRSGVLERSPSLDQIGLFARGVEDLALATEIMSGDDGLDRATHGVAPRQVLSVCTSEPPVDPRFCFVRTPWWNTIDAEAREAYEAFVGLMQGAVVMAELPEAVEQAAQWQATVVEAEFAFSMQREYRNRPAGLSEGLRRRVERGTRIALLDYLTARDRMPHAAGAFDEYFEHYDAILSPAAPGPAPRGVAAADSVPLENVWAFAGLPALSMPVLQLSGDLPLGVQAVGALHNDARFLRAVRWLVNEFIKRSNA